jgi:RNA recognition motif-containing protein
LPAETSEASLKKMFSAYGTVRSVNLAYDIFTRSCKGFGFIEMEGHEARAAQTALDGRTPEGGREPLKVRFENPRVSRTRKRR